MGLLAGDFNNTHSHGGGGGGAPDPHGNASHTSTFLDAASHSAIDHDGLPINHAGLEGVTADQHHAKSHAHDGADGSGTVAHSALTGVSANQHHNQAHSISGADHTGTLAHSALSGIGADDHHAQSHSHASHTGIGADDHHAQSHTHASHTSIGANDHHNQSHVLDSSDHTISGKTAGQFLRATGATAFAFEAVAFARGATVLSPAAANIIVWRAPFACTVTAVKGYRVSGTGATINARRNGSSNHLSSDLSLTSADTWTDGGSVQNTAYAAGDKLEIMIQSVTGSPTQVAVQVDFTRP